MRKRHSDYLMQLKRELHQRAIREKDEDRRKDLWRMYFKAKNAESEVREMVLEAEVKRLVQIMREHGYGDVLPDEPDAADTPPPDDPFDDDDIPPTQKGLWE